jgi:hypothetical protein
VLRGGADDDAGGGLAGGCPFERVPDVVVAVLQRPDEVGVAGARPGESLASAGGADLVEVVAVLGVHRVDPLGPLGVVDHDAQRRAEREPVPEPRDDLELVDLEVHAGRAPVPEPAPFELAVEVGPVDAQPRREPFDGGDERRPVGLPGGQEAQSGHAGGPLRRGGADATAAAPATGQPWLRARSRP